MNDLLQVELGTDPRAQVLIDQFQTQHEYRREFCLELLEVARSGSSSWDLRRLAILMLENQMLKLPHDELAEFNLLFSELGLIASDGPEGYVSDSVLKEGYSTNRLPDFIREFCLKLSRLNRVHRAIRGNKTSNEALLDFIAASRIDCKLSLGRYIFTPAEVIERITSQLKKSVGVKDIVALGQPYVGLEIDHCFDRLPLFESEILRSLCGASIVYWVSDDISSEINSLLEYPLNTVVAVIKPPGSDVEFEIKRVGVKGNRPLDVVYERDGWEVPSTHRLHAGSMAYYLRWEAGAAATLSTIYRLIHQTEAPVSKTMSVATIYTVPTNGDEKHIVQYFSDFNSVEDPDELRRAMRRCIREFRYESGVSTPSLPGDLGLATQFLGQSVPSQSILADTTSFRLDRLESYLSPQGADIYFSEGLNFPFTSAARARRFADELLDEILGVHVSQNLSYRSHDQYIDAAFSDPDNRSRADATYLSIMGQFGKFWGTLMGIRSFSYGESFVARNVGLKSVFEGGDWKIKLIFMDHDALRLTGVRTNHFAPFSSIPNSIIDETYIMGGPHTRGSTEMLRSIYRVSQTIASEGYSALNSELSAAYRKTQNEICSNRRLQDCFTSTFVERIRDWDRIVARYLSIKGDPAKVDSWKDETTALLRGKKYDDALIREHLRGVELYSNFLQRYSFLYSDASADVSTSSIRAGGS
jgi:hypothetical protein